MVTLIYALIIFLMGLSLLMWVDIETAAFRTREVKNLPPKSQPMSLVADGSVSDRDMIQYLRDVEIPNLLETMPKDSCHTVAFIPMGKRWAFKFRLNSSQAVFSAAGLGDTPDSAFGVARQVLQKQVREWHVVRWGSKSYIGISNEALVFNDPAMIRLLSKSDDSHHHPSVLVVDDDIDIANMLESIFRQLGCNTAIATSTEDLARKISFNKTDLIVLDWMLTENISAHHVVERAIRVIDSFSDLRERFSQERPKIVTYSVLEKSQIHLPKNDYFEHLDHWRKPIGFNELTTRSSQLLAAVGFWKRRDLYDTPCTWNS